MHMTEHLEVLVHLDTICLMFGEIKKQIVLHHAPVLGLSETFHLQKLYIFMEERYFLIIKNWCRSS
jgi:hypothetical protein